MRRCELEAILAVTAVAGEYTVEKANQYILSGLQWILRFYEAQVWGLTHYVVAF